MLRMDLDGFGFFSTGRDYTKKQSVRFGVIWCIVAAITGTLLFFQISLYAMNGL